MSDSRDQRDETIGDLSIPPAVSAGTVKHRPEWKWMDSIHPLDRELMKLPYPRQHLTDGMIDQFIQSQSKFRTFRILARFAALLTTLYFTTVLAFVIGCGAIPLAILFGLLWFLFAITLHERQLRSAHRRIIAQRLCLSCGYSMVAQRPNVEHIGICSECGTSFDIRIYCPEKCPKCRYDLTGITATDDGRAHCPECGAACDAVPPSSE